MVTVMKATKIKMKSNCKESNNLLEIDSIYIEGYREEGYYKKEAVYDRLKYNSEKIIVNISPYPELIPAISTNNEKYVKSTPNNLLKDNLLELPRE